MTQVKSGDTVRIHYKGTFADGTVFDSSEGRDPLELTVGQRQVILGLDNALPGMEVGDKKHLEIGIMEAYGPRHLDKVIEVPLEQFPDNIPREVGLMLEMRNQEGQATPAQITAVGENAITLDANHALAGKDLIFDIELVSIG